MWLSLILRNWKLVGIGLIILACGLYVGVLKVQMQYMSSRISRLEAENARQSVLAAERDALITTQNGYVEAWKKAGVENSKRLLAAEKRAAALAASIPQSLPKAPALPDTCSCAIPRNEWLRSELNSLLWR